MENNNKFEKHWRENYDKLVRRIHYRNCDVPEDVVQEAFYRAMKYYDSESPYAKDETEFITWFNTILNNTLRTMRRQEQNKGMIKDGKDVDTIEEVVDIVGKDILVSLSSMPEGRDKQIIIMYYILGFKTKDISDYLNMGHSNVRMILLRWRNEIELEHDLFI